MQNLTRQWKKWLAGLMIGVASGTSQGQTYPSGYLDEILYDNIYNTTLPGQNLPRQGLVYTYNYISFRPTKYAARIQNWQYRARREAPLTPPLPFEGDISTFPPLGKTDLRQDFKMVRSYIKALSDAKYDRDFIFNVIAAYAVKFSNAYYKDDSPENEIDHRPEIYGENDDWETLREVIKENGDDCDGLAVLIRQFIMDAGYSKEQTYMMVLYQPKNQSSHTVAMWYDPKNHTDPILIDNTRQITTQPIRLSHLDRPPFYYRSRAVYNENDIFTMTYARPKN